MPLSITLLYTISIILVLGTGIHILLKEKDKRLNRNFFLFCCSGIFWMISLYFGYFLAKPGSELLALVSTRLTFGFSLSVLYFLLRFVYFFPEKTIAYSKRTEQIFTLIIGFIAIFSSFTPFVYEAQIYLDTLLIKDKIGPLYLVFGVTFLGCFVYINWLILNKIQTLQGVYKKKMFLVEISVILGITPVILSHIILPMFDIYLFQAEVVASTLAFSIAVLYAIQKYRFLDLKFTLSKTVKVFIAVAFSALASYSIFYFLQMLSFPIWVGYALAFLTALFSYSGLLVFLNSRPFYRFFGMTSGEYFVQTVQTFKNRNIIYKNLQELRKNLRQMFCGELKLSAADLVLLYATNKKKFLPLIQYFEQRHTILVSKEIPFLEEQKELAPIKKLTSGAEIYLPLFHVPSHTLLGFLILGKKPFNDLFSKQEIEAIGHLNPYLSLQLSAVLYQSELEKEVKAKTHELSEKYKMEQEVSSTLAHELKTPLAIATNNVYLLIDFLKGVENKITSKIFNELKNLSHNSHQSLKNMKQICENLLLLRELEMTQQIAKHTFNPAFQFEGVLRHYRQLAEEKGLKLKDDIRITHEVHGAGAYLEQVLTILLDNAVKYTQQGSIEVVAEQTGNTLRLMVTDTGIGIAKEKRQVIFERFYRDRNDQNMNLSGIAGLGLGLFIAAKILYHMKGTIRVEDNPEEQGTRFIVEMEVEIVEKVGR